MVKKILVVEDDELSQFVTVEMCKVLGRECLVANDGQQCIDLIEKCGDEIALILMDIHMPNVSGLEAAVYIRDNPRDPPSNLPIVATTADVKLQKPDVWNRHGFTDVISKPIAFDLLSKAVERFA